MYKRQHSSPGSDDIPVWFYKLFANEIGLVVSKIFNTSVAKDFVPDAWRHAIVTPVPKCHPIMSRLMYASPSWSGYLKC